MITTRIQRLKCERALEERRRFVELLARSSGLLANDRPLPHRAGGREGACYVAAGLGYNP